jgi:hypothetical protein
VTFLITTALALLGLALAVAVLRAAFARGPLPWSRTVAVAAVALVGATGLANAGDSLRKLESRHDEWDDVPARDTIERPGGAGVDPAFTAFAKPNFLRGDTYFLSPNAPGDTKLWLNYRFAPTLAVDRKEDADWIVYWQEPDPFRTHGIPLDQVVTHLKWGPDVGLIRVRRP